MSRCPDEFEIGQRTVGEGSEERMCSRERDTEKKKIEVAVDMHVLLTRWEGASFHATAPSSRQTS
jgi:hypothetical protein